MSGVCFSTASTSPGGSCQNWPLLLLEGGQGGSPGHCAVGATLGTPKSQLELQGYLAWGRHGSPKCSGGLQSPCHYTPCCWYFSNPTPSDSVGPISGTWWRKPYGMMRWSEHLVPVPPATPRELTSSQLNGKPVEAPGGAQGYRHRHALGNWGPAQQPCCHCPSEATLMLARWPGTPGEGSGRLPVWLPGAHHISFH